MEARWWIVWRREVEIRRVRWRVGRCVRRVRRVGAVYVDGWVDVGGGVDRGDADGLSVAISG